MDSQTTYMVRLSNGTEFGPAPMSMIVEWAKQRRVPVDALLVPGDGSEVRSVMSDPALRSIIHAPPTSPTGTVTQTSESGLSVMIPTKNPCALIGYYLSIASMVPMLGFLAPVAIVLGIMGFRARLKRPAIHGMAHAWIAMILGFIVLVINVLVVVAIIYAQ